MTELLTFTRDDLMLLQNPKPHTEFRRYNGRLALFHQSSDHINYWETYWKRDHTANLIKRGKEGDLGEFESLIERYVPRDLPVLEAGCGPAHLVAALHARNYHVVGIDYEPQVVALARQHLPHLDIRHGNVLALDLPSASFGCYLSVGVVEHFQEGPIQALREARRVLHPRGVALISVPYLNRLRLKHYHKLQNVPEAQPALSFHQYYYSIDDFTEHLNQAGLKVVDQLPYSSMSFLIREHPLFTQFWHSPIFRERLKRIVRRFLFEDSGSIRNRYGHMIMFICRPISTRGD